MHKFASRYGWDKEKILAMPAFDFFGYYAAIQKEIRDNQNKDLKAAAFTSWRIESTLIGMFGQSGPRYMDYLEANGLLTEQEKEQNKTIKIMQKLIDKQNAKAGKIRADNIMEMDPARFNRKKKRKRGE